MRLMVAFRGGEHSIDEPAEMTLVCAGMKQVLDSKLFSSDSTELQGACGMLMKAILRFDPLSAREVANMWNGLRAMLENGVAEADDPQRVQRVCNRLLGLTRRGDVGGWNTRAVAAAWNGVKAMLKKGVVNAGDRELMLVCERLMDLTATVDGTEDGGKGGGAQAVSNTWNGVKAMLESGVVNLDPKRWVSKACSRAPSWMASCSKR